MRILPALAVLLTVLARPTLAAPFDGKWLADIPAQGKCNGTSTLNLIVADGHIQGQVHNPANVREMVGQVGDDGNGTFSVNGAAGTIRFTGDHFDATWFNGTCDRHAEGDRAPDAGRQAALVEERRQHQASYADLTRRAEAGEKIDYTLLRSEFPYSENWEFYDNKIGGLMTEAFASQKGKDCAAALDQAEQVIRLDFTVSQAHKIKSDCLEDTDRAKSRIESAIADGLEDSLMDSGNGDSEKTATVITSMHEEMRALAKREIQLKTRATQVRGSDGHYYDRVDGISIRNSFVGNWGSTGISVWSKTVFFNVDSFVKGHESKRAAITQAAATVH
jgi:hypothetical protein